jgi:hypothetical protein
MWEVCATSNDGNPTFPKALSQGIKYVMDDVSVARGATKTARATLEPGCVPSALAALDAWAVVFVERPF